MRKALLLLLALAFFAFHGESSAQKKKKKTGGPITGTVFKVDLEQGSLRLIVITKAKKKTERTDPLFLIDDDTKFTFAGAKKEVVGKTALKDIKEGDTVAVTLDADFKTVSVDVRGGPRKK